MAGLDDLLASIEAAQRRIEDVEAQVLVKARDDGIRIVPSPHLVGDQTILMVSVQTYAALARRPS